MSIEKDALFLPDYQGVPAAAARYSTPLRWWSPSGSPAALSVVVVAIYSTITLKVFKDNGIKLKYLKNHNRRAWLKLITDR